ncbi:Protein of unknown function [Bacillus cereus]|nr:Protein of unknown function [Bacillus cereus]
MIVLNVFILFGKKTPSDDG